MGIKAQNSSGRLSEPESVILASSCRKILIKFGERKIIPIVFQQEENIVRGKQNKALKTIRLATQNAQSTKCERAEDLQTTRLFTTYVEVQLLLLKLFLE